MNTDKTISVERIKFTGTPVLCVFGCLTNDRGLEIKKEMLDWLTTKYDVIAVNQEYPGKMFEYPALSFAQQAARMYNKPILYVHTKGAFNSSNVYNQTCVRKLWKQEFIDNYDWYVGQMNRNARAVACPFTGNFYHTTWMNGFMANAGAWSCIPAIRSSTDRFPYEHIFKTAPVTAVGRIMNNCNRYPSKETDQMCRIINAIK